MSRFQVWLYRDGKPVILLEEQCVDRHYMEEIARRYIMAGHADSMGAIGELSE
jgi:hypothetical protein